MAVKFYKKKRKEDDFELHEHDFKVPTVWWGPENSVFWDWCGLWLAVGLILLEEMTNKDKGIFFYVFSSIVNVLNINVFFLFSYFSIRAQTPFPVCTLLYVCIYYWDFFTKLVLIVTTEYFVTEFFKCRLWIIIVVGFYNGGY